MSKIRDTNRIHNLQIEKIDKGFEDELNGSIFHKIMSKEEYIKRNKSYFL